VAAELSARGGWKGDIQGEYAGLIFIVFGIAEYVVFHAAIAVDAAGEVMRCWKQRSRAGPFSTQRKTSWPWAATAGAVGRTQAVVGEVDQKIEVILPASGGQERSCLQSRMRMASWRNGVAG